MAYTVRLETENGDTVDSIEVPLLFLDDSIVRDWNAPFQLLTFLDPYGDTVFNQLQAGQVLQELDCIRERLTNDADLRLLGRVIGLAQRCASTPHMYLRFLGD